MRSPVGLLLVFFHLWTYGMTLGQQVDFITVLDSSANVGENSFQTEKTLLKSLLEGVTSAEQHRLSVVSNNGEILSKWTTITNGLTVLKTAPFSSNGTNLARSLLLTENLLAEVSNATHRLIIVFTASNLDCIHDVTIKSPCRGLATLISNTQNTVIIISARFHDTMWPVVEIQGSYVSLKVSGNLRQKFAQAVMKSSGLKLTFSSENLNHESMMDSQSHRPFITFKDREVSGQRDKLQNRKECSTDTEKIAIDMVYLLDSTIGIGENSFHTLKTETSAILQHFNIGQRSSSSRVAVINLGASAHLLSDLTTYESTEKSVQKAPFLNDNTLNVEAGLKAAKAVLDKNSKHTRQKMVVLWTSKRVECPSDEANDPCRVAHSLESAHIRLVTIDAVFHDAPAGGKKSTIAPDECDRFLSSDSDIPGEVAARAARVNCYCGKPDWFQLTDGCRAYKVCVYQAEMELAYDDASDNCKGYGGKILSIYNKRMNELAQDIATTHDLGESFIGLQFTYNGSKTTWSDGIQFRFKSSYNNFVAWPDRFSCTSFEKSGKWKSSACGAQMLSFCERPACDGESKECENF
ncbi:hypothetical protein L596_013844 [Steinernema carpocapsae]|uniref:C-type lectin domain-containing protein n=1 Tax=Steinernema carpocapsae TaxID=34508 RepID=A0A4U5P1F3_STECR|nr:hypothetical protein L596_013844 [Steinernema carpocapsae]